MNKELYLSPTQMEFLTAEEKYALFCGGLGSGKTYGGAAWAMLMANQHPKTKGLITANSYSQLKKATLTKFFDVLNENEIEYKYKSQEGVIEIGDTTVYAISMENYDLLRGIEVGWAWSDECAFYREDAFNVLIGRIRDRKGPCQWKGTTTPNGFNWLYTRFVETPIPRSRVIYSRTTDNVANLSETYVNTLRANYDTRLAQQELDGQFVNLSSGKVYYGFDRNKNCKVVDERFQTIYCGMDFNVHPLCGVFGFYHDGKIYVSNELYQEDSNTFKAAREIQQRYSHTPVRVIADESGTKRKTSSDTTDYEILRRANLIVEKFKNPSVKDRYNNINRLLDHGLLIIDPKCKKLIEDLEKLTYDNKDPMLSHISDALGYMCWKINPLRKPKRDGSVTYL
jgi:PBSX family phage terminase large subunit